MSRINLKILFFISIILLLVCVFYIYRTTNSAEEYVTQKVTSCNTTTKRNACYQKIAVELLDNYSLENILAVFSRNDNNPAYSTCHELAHYLGQNEYKRTGSVAEIFGTKGADSCLGGVYHGAIEGYFLGKKVSQPIDSTEISNVCGDEKNFKNHSQFIECNHGLGHAFMLLSDNDLPKSLDSCEMIENQYGRLSCYNGAFMANSQGFNDSDHPTKYVKESDPLYPCQILKNEEQKECYVNGTLYRFQNDPKKSESICMITPIEFRSECFNTMGRNLAKPSKYMNISSLVKECSEIEKSEYRTECMKGTLYNIVLQEGAQSKLLNEYCTFVDVSEKQTCYDTIPSEAKN